MRLSKKFQGDLGQAIYETACERGMNLPSVDRIIAAVSDMLDAHGIDPELFEQASGWADEDRTKHRLRRMRRLQ